MENKENKGTIDALLKKIGLRSVEINLETVTVGDGEATLEAEAFEPNQPVFIVDGEDRIPLPVGEYKLDDGRILVIKEEGVIAEVRSEEATEENAEAATEGESNEEETPMAEKEEKQLPKAIIESTVKETKFTKEEIEAIKTELKEEILAELKATEATSEATSEENEVELKEETKEEEAVELSKIVPNPENVEAPQLNFRYGASKPKTTLDKVLSRISK